VNAIELLFDFFEDHLKAAAAVRARRPLALGSLCFALGALSFYVATAVSGRLDPLPFGLITLTLLLLWELAMGFVLTAVLHLIAEMEGRQGSAAELFVLFGMANLIWGLAIPLVMVFMSVLPRPHWPVTAVFLIVGFFNLSLKARSLQDTYQVSSGRAWVTLILPYLATLMASGLALSLAMASLFIGLMKALN